MRNTLYCRLHYTASKLLILPKLLHWQCMPKLCTSSTFIYSLYTSLSCIKRAFLNAKRVNLWRETRNIIDCTIYCLKNTKIIPKNDDLLRVQCLVPDNFSKSCLYNTFVFLDDRAIARQFSLSIYNVNKSETLFLPKNMLAIAR